ncbi:hypothetical protein Hanom_Chr01g00038421 [Helianthus anomalus]
MCVLYLYIREPISLYLSLPLSTATTTVNHRQPPLSTSLPHHSTLTIPPPLPLNVLNITTTLRSTFRQMRLKSVCFKSTFRSPTTLERT